MRSEHSDTTSTSAGTAIVSIVDVLLFHLVCVCGGIPPLRSAIIEHRRNMYFPLVFLEIFILDFLSHLPEIFHLACLYYSSCVTLYYMKSQYNVGTLVVHLWPSAHYWPFKLVQIIASILSPTAFIWGRRFFLIGELIRFLGSNLSKGYIFALRMEFIE